MPQVKEGKKPKFTLGVADAKLGNAVSEALNVPCACNEFTGELLRGVRAHAGHLTKASVLTGSRLRQVFAPVNSRPDAQ